MNAVANDFPSPHEPPFGPVEHVPITLYAALAKAQMEFTPIGRSKTVNVRTRTGSMYTFSYAPLEVILKATLPALNKQGFSLIQLIEGETLVTRLHHASGGYISNTIRILVGESGPQAYGSALTYARRYGVTLLLGVCADDDDDGNAAEGHEAHTVMSHVPEPEPRPPPQTLASSEFVPSGKHKGKKWLEISDDYLAWATSSDKAPEPLRAGAEAEVERRAKAFAEASAFDDGSKIPQ